MIDDISHSWDIRYMAAGQQDGVLARRLLSVAAAQSAPTQSYHSPDRSSDSQTQLVMVGCVR